jgi:hypothetical protein
VGKNTLTPLQDYPTLVPFVEGVVYLLTVMLTTVLAGHLVKLGHGYGTTWGSNLFKGHRRLFIFFLIEAVGLSIAFPYIQVIVSNWLWGNISCFPTIVAEAFVLYYLWFCLTFGYKHTIQWYEIVLPQLVLLANYLNFLPVPFKPV